MMDGRDKYEMDIHNWNNHARFNAANSHILTDSFEALDARLGNPPVHQIVFGGYTI